MTFSTASQRARAIAPTGCHMKTPAHLNALIDKPIKPMAWRKQNNSECVRQQALEREALREIQVIKDIQQQKRRAKLRKIKRIIDIATGKIDPDIIHVVPEPEVEPEYLSSPFRSERLIKLFLEHVMMSRRDVFSKDKFKGIVKNRHMLMWILRDTLGMRTPALGDLFNQKDHSTVLHACNKIGKNLDLLDEAKAIQASILFAERIEYGE